MSELKPCPFCGRTELKFKGQYHANYLSHVVECHCSTRVYGRDYIECITAWNTRAIDTRLRELVEKWRKAAKDNLSVARGLAKQDPERHDYMAAYYRYSEIADELENAS